MRAFFCTACDAGLVFGRRSCPECGARVGPGQAAALPVRKGWFPLSGLGAFLASQAGLSLATLMVFLGLAIALAPVGWTYAHMQAQPGAAKATPAAANSSKPTAAAPVPCSRLLVFFAETATVGEVQALLASVNSVIAFGPDKTGGYELAMPASLESAVAETLNQAEGTVEGVFIRQGCTR